MGRRFQGGVSQKTCHDEINILSFGTKALDVYSNFQLKSALATECWTLIMPIYHRVSYKLIFYILVLCLLTGFSNRVSGTPSDTIHIPEVEVIHAVPIHRTAHISAEMDTISMDLTAGRSLSELLAFHAGLHIKSAGRGALSTVSFRGTDASHTKVYWNGIRLNSPMLGQVDFSLIPVWIADDISLLYGGSSMKEGSGALGGAVLLENSAQWNTAFSLSLNQEIASFGTLGTYGSLSAGDDKIRSNTRIYWNRSLNNYPFFNTDILPNEEQRLDKAGYEKGGILQEIYLRVGQRHELSYRLWYQEAERELSPLMSQEGASREELQEDRNLRTSMEWKTYPGFGVISVRSGFAGSGMHYFLYHNDLEYRQFDSESKENSLYNTIQADVQSVARSRFQFKADFNRHDARINDLVGNKGYDHLRNEGNLMASAYREAGERLVIYALLRQEWADGKWLPIMPSTGFSVALIDEQVLNLKGNLSRNYNLPSLNDLYWIPGGNPELRPENSINGDISLDFSREREGFVLRSTLNVFAAKVEDWILWKPTQFRYWEAENLAKVFSRGMDLQLGSDMQMGEWLLSIKASYAYTRSTNEGDAPSGDLSRGKQLIYIPLHASNAFINLTRSGFSINYTWVYTGRRYTQPSNGENEFAEVLNPYALHDLHMGKSWNIGQGKLGLRFSIYNLFNTTYQAVRSRPMPMRNYALTLRMEI